MQSNRCSAASSRQISNAAPPPLRSIAQVISPPSANVITDVINSSSTVSSFTTRCDNSRLPPSSMTTQWCSDLPASTPTHSCCATTTSTLAICAIKPGDDYADVSLHSDQVASLN